MKRTVKIMAVLTIALALVGPGCYTVISHPANDEGYRASQVSDCTRCHGDYHEYPYGYYFSPYPDYWWEHGAYSSYFADPWWWSYYDYPYMEGDYAGSSHRGTKFDRREIYGEPTPPPYANPNEGFIRPPIDAKSGMHTGPSGDGTSSGTARPNVDDNSSSRSKDQNSGSDMTKGTRQSTKTSPSTPKENSMPTRPEPKPAPKPETPKAEPPKQDSPPPETPKTDESKKGSGGGGK